MTGRLSVNGPVNRLLFVAGIVVLAGAAPASAQINHGPITVATVEKTAPACDGHPDRHWVGRVEGAIRGRADGVEPVSFVGCFADRHSCEVWKGEAGGLVTGVLFQYSCEPRR